jgi:hypothetical protein
VRSWEITTPELEDWLEDVLIPGMNNALVSRETRSGDHCRFCPARLRDCPQLRADRHMIWGILRKWLNLGENDPLPPLNEMETTLKNLFKQPAADKHKNGDLALALNLFDLVPIMKKAYERTAFNRMTQGGVEVADRKIVHKRQNRDWKKGAEVAAEKEFGEDAYTTPEFKSPAQFDTMPKGKAFSARWAFKPEGELTVVHVSDNRRAVESFTLEGGVPVIRPDQPGLVCCDGDPSAAILNSLQSGDRSVEVSLVEGAAGFTTADAEAYGITQPVGGNHAWRDGAPTTAGPGFTTYHAPSGARITNIHRIADLVRGVVIAPGASFSINDHVGRRTAENGFVSAGAISNGEHVDEIGGGISQFATTTFNAAYFAGLQIDESQAHSEYFDRYPRGREATMGFPAPDLAFTNNTPYGIMIWTSYTDTSLTITMYSSPYARGEQTAISEGRSGNCAVVTTTRTVTFPDGRTEDDTFRATYRPGEGLRC